MAMNYYIFIFIEIIYLKKVEYDYYQVDFYF